MRLSACWTQPRAFRLTCLLFAEPQQLLALLLHRLHLWQRADKGLKGLIIGRGRRLRSGRARAGPAARAAAAEERLEILASERRSTGEVARERRLQWRRRSCCHGAPLRQV